MAMLDLELRQQLVAVARRMNSSGINQGTSGNLSARIAGGLLITPTSMPYEQMEAADLVAIDFDGQPINPPDQGSGLRTVQKRPSSEWQLHAEILRSRPEIQAVLHCHSIHATALACHGRPIPSFHYMVAMAGTATIPCAPYSTFGTKALSVDAVRALEGKLACLLAQHGQVALGRSLDQALRLAIEVETLAHMYLQALTLGEPPRLDPGEMERVIALMGAMHYGQVAKP